ncbi:MAPEG family protein [Massilia sp. TS11]|uniref:MAPEG family protein n=1 Tax=Massilia sp. TS11 TaxID=2908003 RepID=UPI001ED9CB78|nr:MAPEG family protein [Massilia sp. TS11]MCG2584781.1 MAPEG family protein [Massilia sp. TS11]
MSMELTILAWTVVLAFAQLALVAAFRNREVGLQYNMSARDAAPPPMGKITARLQRAFANLMETLPLFAIAVLVAHGAGRENASTLLGAQLYLGARVLYVPLYALGVPLLRSLVWGVAVAGIVLVLKPLLM